MEKTEEYTLPIAPAGKIGWPWDKINISPVYSPLIIWPKISIVTPSFNQGKYIEETIRSVLLQNYPNLEYIIIDGGSTDETIAIIKRYEPWISYWESEQDRGQSHAINKGLSRCTGEIFNWLNSDDWYMPDTFFQVASGFLTDISLQVVSGFENHIQLDGAITQFEGTFLEKKLEQTIEFCEVTQPSTFFKLATVREVSGVSEDLHCIMDGEMWVKILLLHGQQSFLKIPKVLVNFRLHESSKTVNNAIVNNFLYERASVMSDLQRRVGTPREVIDYYVEKIYESAVVYQLNRPWKFNNKIISARKLRVYFIRKYVMKQFRRKNPEKAFWGIKQLIKNKAIDIYLLRSIVKLLVKSYR